MLAKRIIPCLDVNQGRVVKGVNFLNLRDAGDPVEIASRYESEGADELVFLDITASHENRGILLDIVRRVADSVFMPFTVGGGIRSVEDAACLIEAGAEKVSINSTAVRTPEVVTDVARRFGSCATVVNIDPRRVSKRRDSRNESESQSVFAGKQEDLLSSDEPWWEVHINGGRIATGLEALSWAKQVESLGAGEIILTSMDADGTKNGFDLEMTQAVSNAVGIPVVASGGAGGPQHFLDVFTQGNADAALAASIFHYGEYTIGETKNFLEVNGVPVRQIEQKKDIKN